MAEVSGMATTFDLPQYVGELFQKNRRPNSFVRLIGGITGGIRLIGAKEFPMGVSYDVDAGAQTAVLEGADPSPTAQSTSQESNVLQIFQQSVKLAYSKMGTNASVSGVAIIPGANGMAGLVNVGTIEAQLGFHMERIQNDLNFSCSRGAYQKPGNNSTGRKMRGLRTAVTTHDSDISGATLTKAVIDTHFQSLIDTQALEMGASITVTGSSAALEILINLYESATQVPESRDEAGVAIRRIITKFATLDLVYDPDVAALELVTWQPSVCSFVAMPIPNKGVLFSEMLSKTGAAEHWQLYGELGIDYRSEYYHGVIRAFIA